MKFNSLRLRLIASTVLLVLVTLPTTALVLSSYYRLALEQTFDARLKLHLDNLIAVALKGSGDTVDQEEAKTINLGEPLFDRPFSGWYWQIRLANGGDAGTIVSDSLLDQRLPSLPDDGDDAVADVRDGYLEGPENQMLRVVERTIIAETPSGKPGEEYTFTVAANASELDWQVARFRNLLLLALGMLGVGLIVAGVVQVRYGLAPLDLVRRGLNEIRTGKAEMLNGDFPDEIEPLQEELNALIRSNREIVERARTHVGNLAHALKTPLSVIANDIDRAREKGGEAAALAENIARNTDIMRDQVRHHLDRARMMAQVGVIGTSTQVRPVAEALIRTLQKIYRDRNLHLHFDCDQGVNFGGEKQDLEEMLGNLLENSFKWAEGKVKVQIGSEPKQPNRLQILIEDDGPGLSASKRQQAMRRGQRLDENSPGSGLGLSIVADLAHLYGGTFELTRSKLGGVCAKLLLPVDQNRHRAAPDSAKIE